jgi:hypothetical protein
MQKNDLRCSWRRERESNPKNAWLELIDGARLLATTLLGSISCEVTALRGSDLQSSLFYRSRGDILETGANLSAGLASVYPQAALAGSPGRPRCRGGPPHLLGPQASLAEPDHASGTTVGDDSQPVAKNGLRRPTIALTGDSATPQGRRDTTKHQPPIHHRVEQGGRPQRDAALPILLEDRRDLALSNRPVERGVVALVLVGVGHRERRDRLVDGVALAQVAADRRGRPGSGV